MIYVNKISSVCVCLCIESESRFRLNPSVCVEQAFSAVSEKHVLQYHSGDRLRNNSRTDLQGQIYKRTFTTQPTCVRVSHSDLFTESAGIRKCMREIQ